MINIMVSKARISYSKVPFSGFQPLHFRRVRKASTRWWFQLFFHFHLPTCGTDPIWHMFFRWVGWNRLSCQTFSYATVMTGVVSTDALLPGLQTALGGGGTKAQGTVSWVSWVTVWTGKGWDFPNPNPNETAKQLLKLSLWNDTVDDGSEIPRPTTWDCI